MKDVFISFVNGDKIFELYENRIKVKLDKKFNANIHINIKIPPIVNSNKDSLKKMNKYTKQFVGCLFNFENILKNENVELDTYYNNLEKLKINKSNFVEKYLNKIFHCVGWYSCKDNKINFNEQLGYENTIYHELLHMASSIYDKKNKFLFCGFSQCSYKNNKEIGKGLNEGYTELLNQKYFSPDSSSYLVETIVAQMFENIIGREKMSAMYFKSNLNSLIDEFSKYNKRENILKFLVYLDFICEYMKKRNSLTVKEKLNESAEFIYSFLIESYHNYLNLLGLEFTKEKHDMLNNFKFNFKLYLAIYGIDVKNNNLDAPKQKK